MHGLELTMYEISRLFMTPVLILISLLFGYALFSLGSFLVEAILRLRGHAVSALAAYQRRTNCSSEDLELWILGRLELLRIATRTAPMLGLVATMIPMGPALLALSANDATGIGENLVIAFAAVIIALVSASITFAILTVRRRWLLTELRSIERIAHQENAA